MPNVRPLPSHIFCQPTPAARFDAARVLGNGVVDMEAATSFSLAQSPDFGAVPI